MTNTKDGKSGPIEVWLRQSNMMVACTVVNEDESTEDLSVDSLSMRGAQREMTGWFLTKGYQAAGRWETTFQDEYSSVESVRRFKPAS